MFLFDNHTAGNELTSPTTSPQTQSFRLMWYCVTLQSTGNNQLAH